MRVDTGTLVRIGIGRVGAGSVIVWHHFIYGLPAQTGSRRRHHKRTEQLATMTTFLTCYQVVYVLSYNFKLDHQFGFRFS